MHATTWQPRLALVKQAFTAAIVLTLGTLPAAAFGQDLPSAIEPALVVQAAPVQPPLDHLADNTKAQKALDKTKATTDAAPPAPEVSQAEQITRLERTIEENRMRIAALRAELDSPESEYSEAEAGFKAIDDRLSRRKAELEALKIDGKLPPDVDASDLDDLTERWTLARERFDLAIETRKTTQQQITTLEAKLAQDTLVLDKLKGIPALTKPEPAETTAPPAQTAPAATTPPPAAASAEETSATKPAPTAPALPATPAAPAAPPPAMATDPVSATVAAVTGTARPASKELLEAQSQAQQKKEVAREAELQAQSVAERIEALEKDIELERKLLVAAQKRSDLAFQAENSLRDEYETKVCEGAPLAELEDLRVKLRDTQTRFARGREEVRSRTDRLTELQQQLTGLQREELAAVSEAQARQLEAEQAEKKVLELANPYSIENLLQWLLDHGPKICLILIVMFVLRMSANLSSQRVVSLIIERGARGTKQEREDRARTLLGVFRNAFSITIIIGGILMLCEEVGVAVGPLMGGAAVLGLAAAFGAQNLIRDYFYGFVILVENQFKINDVLRIGNISGQVEQITLRMTVLRDLEGAVHFIPNGKIDSVTNMTHGWSRAVFEIPVSFKDDADHVMDVLVDLALELRRDPAFSVLIIDDPEMLGVDRISDLGIVIKMLLKTRPLQQWKVRRELLRRIKRRFDELGIEIPYPQRTVHHRMESVDHDKEATPPSLPWEAKEAA